MSDWQQVQSIFLASADLPVEERSRVLDELCGADIALRNEVESLLVADSDSSATIDSAIQGVASTILDTPVLIGERLGVYRVVREIGRGGMGSVYLAVRDDEEYTREVALKVVKRGMNTAEALRRFRDERQILANLDHPYIARLFDGGTTVEGVPYFAMEYVEGRPVDVFCREKSLSVKARCELFLLILDAVGYAHRSLVIHGDLKPANMFVTPGGTPKLLDFGVAKLVAEDGPDSETKEARVFTPGYASPEQVRGTLVTTATDIYSLGAVLYELLSGKRAQPIDFDTPTGIEYAVCDVAVLRPGLVAKDLPADLDQVVLMALNKEPEKRYQSATQFADDIRRCLEGRPVIARENSMGYRARKFIVRNRLRVAMAVLVAMAIIGALIVSLAQTHRARVERAAADSQRQIAIRERSQAEDARISESKQKDLADQQRRLADEQRQDAEKERDEAQSEKAIADQRLQEMVELANRSLFDAEGALASMPGSIPARKKIVQTTLEYLQSLEKTAGNNDDIRETLAAAYYKVALIQGNPRGASLQDGAAAEQSLRKAQDLLVPIYQRHPNETGTMLRWIEIRSTLGDLIYRSGRMQEGIQMYIDLIPVTRRLSQAKNCPLSCETQEAVAENSLANFFVGTDPEQALAHANRAIELDRAIVARHPSDAEVKQGLGVVLGVAATANKNLGNLEQALEYFKQSMDVREELLRADPNNLSLRRNLLVLYGNYAALLGIPWSPNVGRPAEARIYAAKSVAIARDTVSADPSDATARRDLGMTLGRLGMVDPPPGEAAKSLAELQEAGELLSAIVASNPKSFEAASQLGLILMYQALRLEELGRAAEALPVYRRAMALYEPFFLQPNIHMAGDYIALQSDLALLYASIGDKADAVEMGNRAMISAEKYAALPPPTENRTAIVAAAWARFAMVQWKTGSPEQARQNAQKALQMWGSIKNPGLLTAFRTPMENAKTVLDNTHPTLLESKDRH